jgi:hypothetical protein
MAGGPGGGRDIGVDVRDYNRFMGDLVAAAKKNGFGTKQIIRGEAATTLATAADMTNKASTKDIDERYTLKRRPASGANKGVNPNTGGKLIPFVKLNGKWYKTTNYYGPAIFKQIQKRLQFYKKRAKERVWSAKAVWLVVARKAGLFTGRFKSGTSLNKAISAQGGEYETNSTNTGQEITVGLGKYAIKLHTANYVLLNKNARGDFAIRSAMARRANNFEQAMARGCFKSAEKVARQYPGIVMKERANAP